MRFMTTFRPAVMLAVLVASVFQCAMTVQPAGAQTAPPTTAPPTTAPPTTAPPTKAPFSQIKRIYGILVGVDLTKKVLSLKKRNGQIVVLDISLALSLDETGVLPINRQIVVYGVRGTDKLFHVQSIGHSAPTPKEWGDDTDSGDANSAG
jgi:hypothetical protein